MSLHASFHITCRYLFRVNCTCFFFKRHINIISSMSHNFNAWGADGSYKSPGPRPPGLRGKAIGLYYRDRGRIKKKQYNQIHLKIPPAILQELTKNLDSLCTEFDICYPLYDNCNTNRSLDDEISNLSSTKTKIWGHSSDSNVSKSKSGDNSNIRVNNLNCENRIEIKKETNSEGKFKIEIRYGGDHITESIPQKIKTEPYDSNTDNSNNDNVKRENLQSKVESIPEPNKAETTEGTANDEHICNNVTESSPKRLKVDTAMEIDLYSDSQPSTSKESLDYVPVGKVSDEESRRISNRNSYYKCRYLEIITDTFDNKLSQCLLNRVNITEVNEETKGISESYYKKYKEGMKSEKQIKLMRFREKLPTYQKSSQILEVINNNQIVIISGETGCGKSTQVPQIILDDAINKMEGANVNILVTQPRRIAASSLAMRVAEERGERLGTSVGYAVRLEKVEPRTCGHIMFCTTGVLLADLGVNQSLSNYSHVILDEVHERNCDIDLSMSILKKIIAKRKDLKLILMSATLDAETLTSFFNNAPLLHIEGLAYPVQDIYLEEILNEPDFRNYQLPENLYQKSSMKKQWNKRHGGKGHSHKMSTFHSDYKRNIDSWIRRNRMKMRDSVHRLITDTRIEEINVDLIMKVILHICVNKDPGAILVFLPGIADISKLVRAMDDSEKFRKPHCIIYPLHSKLSSVEQHQIFERPPSGVRKIIIATNIAETSITIDDIVYVIDSGKMKMSGLNIDDNIATLQNEWVSKANLRQRRGRAGRCQAGICYHLITTYRANLLEENVAPEIQRTNLLEQILLIKRLMLGKSEEALMTVPDPPATSTIVWAVRHLQQLGALDQDERLTPLGWHLARLPVHPAAGKLVVLGALFGCLDRAASVAAVWGFNDPFQLVIGKEAEVDEAKRLLAIGEPSDHIAISEAVIEWEKLGRNVRRSFAYENFLSNKTLEMLSDMKKQLGDNLRQMGFLSSGDVKAKWENRNTHNLSLFKAIIAASLYPNIATVRWMGLHSQNPKKSITITARTPEDGRVSLHPSSVMGNKKGGNLCPKPGANWLVYWRKQKSTDLFLIDVTLVYTLPLVFFGEIKIVDADDGPDKVNIHLSTIEIQCTKETATVLNKLRGLLNQVLASRINVPNNQSNYSNLFEEKVLKSVIELITAEDEQAEYLGED